MSQQEELIKFAHELREATRYTWLYDRCNSIANRLEYFAKAADFDRSLKLAQQTTAALERDRAVDPASLREPYMTDKVAQCPACGGNDGDMPCAFPKANEAQPGCLKNAKDAQWEADPVARVSGYHAGRCVIEPLSRTSVLPVGMALYSESVPSSSKVLVEAPDGAELRWCIGKEIHGRPTSHDTIEYAATVGANLACGCDKCTTTLALWRRQHEQE